MTKMASSIFEAVISSPTLLLITVVSTILIYFILTGRITKSNGNGAAKLPPGPPGIPLLGNLHQMVKDPHLKLSQWAKEYGKICTIYLAQKPAVLINDPKWLKEILGTPASTGKFRTDTILLISQGPNGIVNNEGKAWSEQRQFCIKSLKEYGFGNVRFMEPLILREVDAVCEWIQKEKEKKSGGGTILISDVLNQATVNALWTLVSGERITLGDSEVVKLLRSFTLAMQYTMKTGLGFFPWLKYFAPKLSGYVEFDKVCKDVHQFIGKKFKEHEETYVEGERRDLIDSYIEHMRRIMVSDEDGQSSFWGKAGRQNSVSSVVEIFLSGGDTTATTLNWALIYLSQNQQVQKKLREEIDEIVGKDRDPSVMDRVRMPYTEAVIQETLRISSIVPLGVIHRLLEDLPFHGYNLPKDTLLIPNMYHIHHDNNIWGDPEVFRPERFLVEGGVQLKDNCLVAFQAGKRQCIGESLARDVLFLFIAKLIQQFYIAPDQAIPAEEYFKPDVGLLLMPKPLGLVLTSR